MKTWGMGFTGIVLACSLAACGGGDGGSLSDGNGFTMSATVNGAKVQSFNGGSGQTTTLTVKSGQDLRLDTSSDVIWTSVNASQTDITPKGSSTQSWTAGLKSPPGGTVTFVITSVKDPSKSAKLTVTVSPHEYAAPVATAGRVINWTETGTQQNGAVVTHARANTTATVSNGGYTVNTTLDGAPDDSYTYDADGNRLSRTYPNRNVCTYTPKRGLLNFPLQVGKSWTSAWNYSCSNNGTANYHEVGNVTSIVEGYESISTPAGTRNALRIHHVQAMTNSNDGNLQGGSTSTAAYTMDYRCWWDVDGQRTVKCDFAYTYQGAAPATYLKSFTQVVTSVQ